MGRVSERVSSRMCSTSCREEGGRASQVVGVVNGSKEARAWRPTQKFWFEAEVQFVWVCLHLLLYFLLVMINLPSNMDMHCTPLPWLPQYGPERICQPGILLQEGMGHSSRSGSYINWIRSLGLKCSLQ